MPIIMPIKDLGNTTEISNIAHKELEEGGVSIDLDEAFEQLDRKYYG